MKKMDLMRQCNGIELVKREIPAKREKRRKERVVTCAQAVKLANCTEAIPSNTVPAIDSPAPINANTHPAINAL